MTNPCESIDLPCRSVRGFPGDQESRPLTGLGPVIVKAGGKAWVASQVRGSTSEVQR